MKILFFLFWLSIFISQTAMDVVATIIFLFAVVTALKARKEFTLSLPKILALIMCAWLIVIGIGLWQSDYFDLKTLEHFLEFRWMIEFLLWIWLLQQIEFKESDFKYLVAPPLFASLYGFLNYAVLGFSLTDREYIADRVGGFYDNPMSFAQNLGPVLIFLIPPSIIIWSKLNLKNQSLLLGSHLLMFAALVFTMTRGVWIGFFIAFLILQLVVLRRKSLHTIPASIAILAIAFSFMPTLQNRATQTFDQKRSYDSERVVLWKTNYDMWKDRVWFGHGYSETNRKLILYYRKLGYPEDQFQSHAHNQYLHFLSGTGALGLSLYIIFILYILFFLFKNTKYKQLSSYQKSIAHGAALALICFCINSMTEANFSIAKNRTCLLFILSLGLSVLIYQHRRQQALASQESKKIVEDL